MDRVLAASYLGFMTVINMNDLTSTASSSKDDLNDVTSHDDVPTFGTVQPKFALPWLYQLVTALLAKSPFMASVVVSSRDRITAVEATRAPAFAHGQETKGSDTNPAS